jgi:hypothetical protein
LNYSTKNRRSKKQNQEGAPSQKIAFNKEEVTSKEKKRKKVVLF